MKENPAIATPIKGQFLTLPNLLTLTRLALVPVFLVLSLKRQTGGALIVFTVAGLTDFLDGVTARLFHLRSRIGALLDPLADKVLMTTAFLVLTFQDQKSATSIPLWLTTSVIGRDLLIVGGALVIYRWRGTKSFPPSILGKINTVLQVTTVFLVLLANFAQASGWTPRPFLSGLLSPSVLSSLFLLTFASTLISGLHYTLRGASLFFSSRPE